MIEIDKLRSVNTILVHDNCPDGLASALILNNVLPQAKIQYLRYNTPELTELKAVPGQLFCDFSPPAERAEEFVQAGTLVLDHHKTAKEVVEKFGANGVFGDEAKDPGVSGAVLAYREVWLPLWKELCFRRDEQVFDPLGPGDGLAGRMMHFAKLAGIRDTWVKKSPLWVDACAQAESIMFWPRDMWFSIQTSPDPFAAQWDSLLKIGPVLLTKQAEKVQKAIDGSVRFASAKGTRVLMFQGMSTTSDAAEVVGGGADLVVGFGYDYDGADLNLRFSLRSHTTFDCSSMGKKYGGGGHTKAAGFRAVVDMDSPNPFRVFQNRLDLFEASSDQVPLSWVLNDK